MKINAIHKDIICNEIANYINRITNGNTNTIKKLGSSSYRVLAGQQSRTCYIFIDWENEYPEISSPQMRYYVHTYDITDVKRQQRLDDWIKCLKQE